MDTFWKLVLGGVWGRWSRINMSHEIRKLGLIWGDLYIGVFWIAEHEFTFIFSKFEGRGRGGPKNGKSTLHYLKSIVFCDSEFRLFEHYRLCPYYSGHISYSFILRISDAQITFTLSTDVITYLTTVCCCTFITNGFFYFILYS